MCLLWKTSYYLIKHVANVGWIDKVNWQWTKFEWRTQIHSQVSPCTHKNLTLPLGYLSLAHLIPSIVNALKVVPNYVCHIDQSSLEVFMRTFISFLKYLELKGEFVLREQIGNLQHCWTNSKTSNLSSFFEGSKIVK
jgi:hypothetical protein